MAGLILLPCSAAVSRRGVLGGAAAASLAAQHAAPACATAAQRCVYVAGATGRTGRRVVEELLRDRDQFDVVAGARTEASAARLPAGVARLVADLSGEVRGDEAELASMLRTRQVTDVVCTLGYSPTYLPEQDRKLAEAVDYLGTLRLLTACEAAALPGRFVLVSSLGVDAATDSARLLDASLGGVLVQKRRAEEAVRRSSLDWTIVRPGLLLQGASQGGVLLGGDGRWTGDALADRVAGMEKPVKCASPFVASGGAVCAATRQQVARVCVAALEGGPRYSRRVLEVVTRPEVADDGTMRVDGPMARTLG